MNPLTFFLEPKTVAQKQYEALRLYYVEGLSAHEVAGRFGYTYRAFTSLVSSFREKFSVNPSGTLFFVESTPGRKTSPETIGAKSVIIDMRKKYYSVPDIKVALDGLGHSVSEKNIYNVIAAEGFSRLPRRTKLLKQQLDKVQIQAEKSAPLSFVPESFKSSNAGILMFMAIIKRYGIDSLIAQSNYSGTSVINTTSSILCFLALKLANRRRYSSDDTWCMDRGMGLFAGLNVLPKTAWYTSYSDRVTTDMNLAFLKKLHQVWLKFGLLEDTANLDFTTIPYWGDDSYLENNWSGKRGKALGSILAVLAHDPDSGLIDYASANVLQKSESAVVLEFLDFYRAGNKKKDNKLRYIIFDSKFTNYENLRKLDQDKIRFITIRRRGKLILEKIAKLPEKGWANIKVECAGNKHRTLRVYDEIVFLNGYAKDIRQITITGNGKIKPAVIITNDTDLTTEQIVRKYARRWMVEKTISEQIDFFHLNLVSSSMVIKVDFDLTMSILAHNLYRLFALELGRYEHLTSQSLYDKFVLNGADIEIGEKAITVQLKKKRELPLILEVMQKYNQQNYSWLGNKNIIFKGASYS
ncbi:MAG: IS4/IS5 family transposase [Porphyromonadaceae bacterium]|nr:MAG: IS4/IS5 family transposase [Porphyromonadaceae bacterium]